MVDVGSVLFGRESVPTLVYWFLPLPALLLVVLGALGPTIRQSTVLPTRFGAVLTVVVFGIAFGGAIAVSVVNAYLGGGLLVSLAGTLSPWIGILGIALMPTSAPPSPDGNPIVVGGVVLGGTLLTVIGGILCYLIGFAVSHILQ